MHLKNRTIAEFEECELFIDEKKPYQGFAYLYDALLGNAIFPLVRRNFEWLIKQYGIRGRSVADVACGTGSFVSYLTKWRVQVFGIDRSFAMLRIALQKNWDNGTRFLQQDMRQLKLPHPVDVITCNFDSLNYLLTIPDLMKAFCGFYVNLTERGHLIFDMITDACKERGPTRYNRLFTAPGIISLWVISWNPRSRLRTVVIENYIKMNVGTYRCEREVHQERAYPIRTILELLKISGLKVRGIHDARSLRPATWQTTRAVVVAQKRTVA